MGALCLEWEWIRTARTHARCGRFLEKTNLATAFLLAERFSRSPDPAIECIMGGTDKDQVQSLQAMTGRIRMNSSGVLKSEFTALN